MKFKTACFLKKNPAGAKAPGLPSQKLTDQKLTDQKMTEQDQTEQDRTKPDLKEKEVKIPFQKSSLQKNRLQKSFEPKQIVKTQTPLLNGESRTGLFRKNQSDQKLKKLLAKNLKVENLKPKDLLAGANRTKTKNLVEKNQVLRKKPVLTKAVAIKKHLHVAQQQKEVALALKLQQRKVLADGQAPVDISNTTTAYIERT